MRATAHTRDATGAVTAFPRWAVDAGLRPVDAPITTFSGTLPSSNAGFLVSRVGATTTVRAAAPAAAGLPEPVYAWWDPVYAELACGARRVEHSDIAHAFLSDDLRRALSDPHLAGDGDEPAVVAWTSGQVVVRRAGSAGDPGVLGALVHAADAAVVAVSVARLERLSDLDLGQDLPCRTYGGEDEAPADGAHESEFFAELYAGYHGLRAEECSAFQTRFWALGIACAPTVLLRGVIPGTAFSGLVMWGRGPGGCAAAAVAVPVPDGMQAAIAWRAEPLPGASMAGGYLLVVAADEAPPVGLELVEEVTRRTAALLA